jgi:hypothetical protein
MPTPLSVAAATMPAICVPWPFGSLSPSPEPVRMFVPATTLPTRSGCEASTPVSSTATVAFALGVTESRAVSQPMRGSDHWSPYLGSFGTVAVSRL